MIVRNLIDTSDTTANSAAEIVCNIATDDMLLNYDLAGGSAAATREIRVYGRLPDASATIATGDVDAFDASEWILLAEVTGLDDGDNGQFVLDHAYPHLCCAITGNARASRIRVWAAFNEMGDR